MLNPIEECFSKVKNFIRTQRCQSDSSLLSSVNLAFVAVSASDCSGWYRHSKKFLPQCFNKKPIQTEPEDVSDLDSNFDEHESEDELLG